MPARRHRLLALTGPLLCLPLWLSGAQPSATAAETSATAPRQAAPPRRTEELGEVEVTAERPTRKPSDLIAWIRRLPGKYSFEGRVDLGGKGLPDDRWTAWGSGTCVAFGLAPGVQCEIDVRWPRVPASNTDVLSGVSDLTPAMVLFGMEPDDLGIRYLQVNSKGLAEGTTGLIVGDTATFRTPCVNAPAGCERIMRITAVQESEIVEMQIDTEVNYELAARFNLRMRRTGQPQAIEALQPAEAAQP